MNSQAKSAASEPWTVVLASMACLIVGGGVFSTPVFGLFIKPLGAEFGWGRSTVSLGITLFLLTVASAAPIFGYLVDGYGLQRPTLISAISYGTILILLGILVNSLTVFLLLLTLMGLLGAASTIMPYSKVIALWFDRKRGLALGVAISGVGFGGIIVPQIASWLISNFGWRGGFMGLGALFLAVSIPAILLRIKEPQQGALISVQPATQIRVGEVWREVRVDPKFWLITFPVVVICAATTGTIVQMVPMLSDRGFDVTPAVGIVSVVGFTSLVLRLLCGYVLDLFHAPTVTAIVFVVTAAGLLLLASGLPNTELISGMLIGAGLGCEADSIGYLVSRYFKLKHFGVIYGFIFTGFGIGNGIGAYSIGLGFDIAKSYAPVLVMYAVSVLIAAAALLRLGRYRFPPGITQDGLSEKSAAPESFAT